MACQGNSPLGKTTYTSRNPAPDEILLSSPVLPSATKPKKRPTVTPRTFTRFFTPRSSLGRGAKIGASRKALRDITASASNRNAFLPPRTPSKRIEQQDELFAELPKTKKRRILPSPDTTPDRSSPLRKIRGQPLRLQEDESLEEGQHTDTEEDVLEKSDEENHGLDKRTARLSKARIRSGLDGSIGRVLRRQLGASSRVEEPRSLVPGSGWQMETANFFSRNEDMYFCTNIAAPLGRALPFCTVGCNTNPLVAIGDEEGGVRLLESAKDGRPGFSKAYLAFRPHTNAILDLTFSSDDMLMATASGDQTAQIIDMPSQRTIFTMAGHVSSVKQVRFQPGNSNSVLATSSRDGSVQIWDRRCTGFDGPVRTVQVPSEASDTSTTSRTPGKSRMTWARSIDSIYSAHAGQTKVSPSLIPSVKPISAGDTPSKTEAPSRRGDISVTALSFLYPSQEHLLLTASEANASVKLWDLRTTHNHRRGRATPLSTTRQPESHDKHRHFGLTSLALGGDGARLYTLCRDNTIYTYSTSHLVLGYDPELSLSNSRARRSGGPEKEGLGPMYGFRHPQFHATTFYVKSALRHTSDDRSELLAVGSSDGCAVVFPTDERYLQRQRHRNTPESARLQNSRTSSAVGFSARLNDSIPIYQNGSAFVRGHEKEVTSLTWTSKGELVTVGDDAVARCWREGPDARDLRMGGEQGGRRWGCGWAEADSDWDDDE